MKSAEFIKREAINWIFILLPFIYIYLVYDKLPQFAPFQISASQTIYQVILFLMGFSTVSYLILLIKPSLVPKTSFNDNPKSYHRMKTLMLAWTSILSLAFISDKIGIAFNWSKITFILAAVYMMAIGNLYPTIRFNYFFGIKNSWTQTDELIWKKTHHFAGKVYFWAGLAGALYGIFFNVNPNPFMPLIVVGYVFAVRFIPVIYSYSLFRKLHTRHQD